MQSMAVSFSINSHKLIERVPVQFIVCQVSVVLDFVLHFYKELFSRVVHCDLMHGLTDSSQDLYTSLTCFQQL